MRLELSQGLSLCLALILASTLALALLAGCATTSTQTTSTQTTSTQTSSGSANVGDGAGPLRACTSQSDCGDGEFCRFALGACGGTGSCEPRPEICTKEFKPVCACDQNTYSNACGAASEGLSILSQGRCGT